MGPATDKHQAPTHRLKLFKLYPGGFAEYTYPQFQNSQELALDVGVIFDTLANNNEFHADGVFISAL